MDANDKHETDSRELVVNNIVPNRSIADGDSRDVYRRIFQTKVCLHDVRLSEDVSVNIRGGSAEARTIYIPA